MYTLSREQGTSSKTKLSLAWKTPNNKTNKNSINLIEAN